MAKIYRIHPAIGIARLGNSTTAFYLGPETLGGLPIEVNSDGDEQPASPPPFQFRDDQKRVKRQAARFRIYEYDDANPQDTGAEISVGQGDVVDIEWTVHLANKKASWYTFEQLQGEHGYSSNHPLRNPQVKGKARQNLIIDPGPQTIKGPKARAEFAKGTNKKYDQTFPPPLKPFSIETLGEILTDSNHRLLVLGGYGNSGSIVKDAKDPDAPSKPVIKHYANNDYWFDDISDGPVTAKIILKGGKKVSVDEPAWVIVGYPAYAPQIQNIVTLDDVLYDVAVRYFGYDEAIYGPDPIFEIKKWNRNYKPNFNREILPILKRPNPYQWVSSMVQDAPHSSSSPTPPSTPGGPFYLPYLSDPTAHQEQRQFLFTKLRHPFRPNHFEDENEYPLMPLLNGDNPLNNVVVDKFITLTQTHYFLLEQWVAGNFTNDQTGAQQTAMTGEDLDKAVVGNCVGGAFCPGAEVTWFMRNPGIYTKPYRIKHKKSTSGGLSLDEDLKKGLEAGDITKRMALPWQADFYECSTQEVDVTYEAWNVVPDIDEGDDREINPTLWWPAHRPMQIFLPKGGYADWDRGLPEDTNKDPYAGDLAMVTAWKYLGFVLNVGSDAAPNFVEVERDDAEIKKL